MVLFCLFSSDSWLCFQLIEIPFLEVPSEPWCPIKVEISVESEPAIYQLRNSSYGCVCQMDNNHHNCTSRGNDTWNLKCRRSTVCSPETVPCYECDLETMQKAICCNSILKKGRPKNKPFKFICKETRCPQNSESRKTGRYYKNTTTTLNKPKQSKMFISASFFGLLAKIMITLNFVSLQPMNN